MKATVVYRGNMVSFGFLLLCVNFQFIVAKPFFDTIFCDLFCEDDDSPDDASKASGTDFEDILSGLWDPCSQCSSSSPSSGATNVSTTPKKPAATSASQPISIMIPPSTGMNLTLTPSGNSFQMSIVPLSGPAAAAGGSGGPAPATPAPATTTAGAATTAAPATTAAGAATTAAAGATTAAPTTKKA